MINTPLLHHASSKIYLLARVVGCVLLGLALSGQAWGQATQTSFKFDFGSDQVPATSGFTKVLPSTAYSKESGFGFEPGAAVQAVDRGSKAPAKQDIIASDNPFLFSVAVPEGNYQVVVTLGDPAGESQTTVKAEIRRLMVENAHLEKGKLASYTFNVNIRTPQIPGGGTVRLKPRETTSEARAWDDKLTLEFDGVHPCVSAIEIKKLENIPVVYVCGDSTACDQPGENNASWGQMLTRFFKTDVVIANHGESGESLRGFLGEKRWAKVMSLLKPGDYVILQMGHNDEKEKGQGVGALTTFKADLKRFVADARGKGATIVIVSPMERRNFDADGKVKPSHGDYPEAFREVAKEDHVAFIDLTAMSVQFYEAMGADKAYLAFAGTGTQRDATHHDNYGAYELAKCIVQGIRDNKLDLSKSIVDDFTKFDPAKPDPVESFNMARGPGTFNQKPLGN
jgi:lysophospholipase L1-like esterase